VDRGGSPCGRAPFLVHAYAEIGGLVAAFLLGNVEIAVLTVRDFVLRAHAGPHAEKVGIGREYLDALVRAIGDIELARVDREAVWQGGTRPRPCPARTTV
jgi:hypothetical protein